MKTDDPGERSSRQKEEVLDAVLWKWTKHQDPWTVRDAVEGVQVFGATGSGKTSGSGAAIASAFLNGGRECTFGGLVLTAKQDDFAAWTAPDGYLAKAKRSDALIEISPEQDGCFNFLSYEFNRPRDEGGQLTHNVVSLLLSALTSDAATVSREDPYWNEALRELLTHAVDLLVLATQDEAGHAHLGLDLLFKLVRSAPQTPAEAMSGAWRSTSQCAQYLVEAERRRDGGTAYAPGRDLDLTETQSYWLQDFPRLSDRTRSVVVSSFTAKVAGLLRHPLRKLFCSDPSRDNPAWRPESSFVGKVIVLNLPVMTYGEVGRIVQLLYKGVWQRAVRRRRFAGPWTPVFLWADESQYFVTRDDMLFQQTARSQLCSTVYLTQNLPNYYAALDGSGGTAATDSLLGNLQTKVFHANGEPATNEWAQRVFGQTRTTHETTYLHGKEDGSSTPAFDYVIPAIRFGALQKGGPARRVGAYVFQAGRPWRGAGTTSSERELVHYHEFQQPDVT